MDNTTNFDELEKLKKENKTLKIRIEQARNENFILNLENDENSEKYLELMSQLEGIVDHKSELLEDKITQQERTEIELIQTQNLYRSLVENANDGVVLTKDKKIVYANPTLKKMLKIDNFKKNVFYDIFPQSEKEKLSTFFEKAYNHDDSDSYIETIMLGDNSKEIPVEINSAVLNKNNQQILFFIRDISYRKLMDEKRLILEQQRSVLAMAVTANHEMNQPLMIIQGSLELINSSKLCKNADIIFKKNITRISDSLDRIKKILLKFKETSSISFTDYTDGTEMIKLDNE